MTTGEDQAAPATAPSTAPADNSPEDTPLPDASVGAMAGLLQILAAHGGQSALPPLAGLESVVTVVPVPVPAPDH